MLIKKVPAVIRKCVLFEFKEGLINTGQLTKMGAEEGTPRAEQVPSGRNRPLREVIRETV